MNTFLLWFIVVISFAHLLYSGDAAWFTKESMLESGIFLSSVVIYNLTRRRHFRIQKLGTLYLAFWTTKFTFHFLDRILLSYNIDILKQIIFITAPIFLSIFAVAYLILREVEEQWNRKK